MDRSNARKRGILVSLAIVGLLLATLSLAELSSIPGRYVDGARNNGTPGWVTRGDTEGVADHLVINEAMYNPLGPDPDGQWVELYNPKNVTVDISGWFFTDDPTTNGGGTEGSRQFPSFTYIPRGGTVIIANSGFQFYANYGFYPDFEIEDTSSVTNMIVVAGTLALANSGDDVHIFDAALAADVDTFWFGDGGDIGIVGAAPLVPEGDTSERIPAGEDTDNCAADSVDQTVPTPGVPVPEFSWTLLPTAGLCIIFMTFRNHRSIRRSPSRT